MLPSQVIPGSSVASKAPTRAETMKLVIVSTMHTIARTVTAVMAMVYVSLVRGKQATRRAPSPSGAMRYSGTISS